MSKRRFLPKYVTRYVDKHGHEWLRFRRKGYASGYFKTEFGTPEFGVEYRAFNAAPLDHPLRIDAYEPGSIHDLCDQFYRSSRWNDPGRKEATRRHDRRIIERFRAQHGHRKVADLEVGHIETILGRMSATPTAANKLRKQLKRLMRYAVRLKMRADNPLDDTMPMKVTGTGYHTWTEDEIARFQAAHPIGTKARLAFELMLWTGQRLSDIIRISRQHMSDGKVDVVQDKTGRALRLPVPQQLLEAIVATRNTGPFTLLVNDYNRPFTPAGFGNRMRKWCDTAGLPNCTSHGLRKALSRRLAEIGTGNQGIKSVTGHVTDSEVARYTRDADQERMAAQAIAALSQWEMSRAVITLDTSGQESG